MQNKVWIELPEFVELGWKKDMRELLYHKQINSYQGIFIYFTIDKVIVKVPYESIEELRENDLVWQIDRILSGIEIY